MISKEELNELYWNQKLSLAQVVKKLGIPLSKVRFLMTKYGIPRRAFSTKGIPSTMRGIPKTEKQRRLQSLAMTGRKLSPEHARKVSAVLSKYRWGSKNPAWKGGITIDGNGYMCIAISDHPRKRSNGYVGIHVLILEHKIGRYLEKDEVCHHIDENKLNNHPDNLQLMTFSEHSKHHVSKRHKEGRYDSIYEAIKDRN